MFKKSADMITTTPKCNKPPVNSILTVLVSKQWFRFLRTDMLSFVSVLPMNVWKKESSSQQEHFHGQDVLFER